MLSTPWYKEWIRFDEYPKTSLWISGNGTPAEWDGARQIEMPFDTLSSLKQLPALFA
jgi:hypothetical protein